MLDVGRRDRDTFRHSRPGGEQPAREVEGTPFLCITCGTQFSETPQPPAHCPICEDEQQYVNPDGQKWTTLEELCSSHKNTIKQEEPDLYSINTEPRFGIGQRTFLIRTDKGNVLWDCVALLDAATVARVNELGGIAEIAISHPHYYTSMVEWSRASAAPDPSTRSRAAVGHAARSQQSISGKAPRTSSARA